MQRSHVNAHCEWFGDAQRPLNLLETRDRDHLRDDAQLAEELAVRYGDVARTSRPDSLPGARRRRQECLERLFDGIATRHRVSAAQISEAALRRNIAADGAFLFLPMAALLGFAAKVSWRRVYQEAGARSRLALVVMAVASLVASSAVLLFGEVWADAVEMFRNANTHLSMRANRVPWTGHRYLALIVGILIFWSIGCLYMEPSTKKNEEPSA